MPILGGNDNLQIEVDVLLLPGMFAYCGWKVLCFSGGVVES